MCYLDKTELLDSLITAYQDAYPHTEWVFDQVVNCPICQIGQIIHVRKFLPLLEALFALPPIRKTPTLIELMNSADSLLEGIADPDTHIYLIDGEVFVLDHHESTLGLLEMQDLADHELRTGRAHYDLKDLYDYSKEKW